MGHGLICGARLTWRQAAARFRPRHRLPHLQPGGAPRGQDGSKETKGDYQMRLWPDADFVDEKSCSRKKKFLFSALKRCQPSPAFFTWEVQIFN